MKKFNINLKAVLATLAVLIAMAGLILFITQFPLMGMIISVIWLCVCIYSLFKSKFED
jgi:uncharacterized membrane protein YqjE